MHAVCSAANCVTIHVINMKTKMMYYVIEIASFYVDVRVYESYTQTFGVRTEHDVML